jgi:alkylhydroperoxidase/carboxymuconolactone decarboxylase family protein YurZ
MASRIYTTLTDVTAADLAEAQDQKKTQALTPRQQAIVPIAAFTATGDMVRLATALHEGLDAGLTINEIKEVLVQLYAYAGFPRSLNGLAAFMGVVQEREKKGIRDTVGKDAGPLPAGKSLGELGAEIQTRLVGAPYKSPLMEFSPIIDRFLKEHLFGDIFGRDTLDFQSREIATVSALASMEGLSAQLRSHAKVSLNVGLTEAQMRDLVAVLEASVGAKEAQNANAALGQVLNP